MLTYVVDKTSLNDQGRSINRTLSFLLLFIFMVDLSVDGKSGQNNPSIPKTIPGPHLFQDQKVLDLLFVLNRC
jgi:hypothetical protein